MSIRTERTEIDGIVGRLMDNIEATMTSQQVDEGTVKLRLLAGDMRANYLQYLGDGTFGAKLADCFETIYEAQGSKLALVQTRKTLIEEETVGETTEMVVMVALSLCLATEAKVLSDTTFVSRDDVDLAIRQIRDAFVVAIEMASEFDDPANYQSLLALSGSTINHLDIISRPLPRMVTFKLKASLPALAVSNLVYYTGDRWEEIVLENHVIHPAFCLRELRGLSA